jgi:hypothetical protein
MIDFVNDFCGGHPPIRQITQIKRIKCPHSRFQQFLWNIVSLSCFLFGRASDGRIIDQCARTYIIWCPNTARDRLQAAAMLVRGEDLDRLSRALCGLLDNASVSFS